MRAVQIDKCVSMPGDTLRPTMLPRWTSRPSVPSKTPTRDPACSSCETPVTSWYKHNPFASHLLVGEIISINESVHAPIDLIFAQGRLALRPARASSKGPRPAIVFERARPIHPIGQQPLPPTTALLLTTYKKIHSSKLLPALLKDYFAVPVSPHCEVETCEFHLHVHPEWQEDNVWLIAYPITSFGAVHGRWSYVNRRGEAQKDLSFKIGDKALTMLSITCNERMQRWIRRCKEVQNHAQRCMDVYEVRMQLHRINSVLRLPTDIQR
ncbi:hypothetical protein OH76DRAFT_651973 [Lentinus brumalis]|uniref:Uncharacterized protein n=1 Tax=Lentinus brumalis TaxID=2498619 RepID=A0A371D856_9APHY|nr:hypothetical protein OH76DRAFT_651973 [Polyporus brumalis]